MSQKVIDVSSYQGTIDWKMVKSSGVEGAVLKVIRKDLAPDNQFENNWKGCKAWGVPIVGVYNYSYATTLNKARSDAKRVIAVLTGRKAKIWMDVEDACLKGLGIGLIYIIQAYQEVIEGAGLEFGVYTGLSFYNSYIRPYASYLKCNFWVARYPSSLTKPITYTPDAKYQPVVLHTMEGWQFSSKGAVPGIVGNVDMSVWYGDIMDGAAEPGENPYPVPERLLRLKLIRMRGEDVKWLQYHLNRLKFPAGKIDGIYGPATDAAVRAAQEHFGISVDGIVGAVTVYVLRFN